jgi:hypothetical protein
MEMLLVKTAAIVPPNTTSHRNFSKAPQPGKAGIED